MKKKTYEQLGRISTEEFRKSGKIPLLIILDDVRSLHNVGSTFRTADCFSAEKLILCGITGCPPHRDIHKAALGAELSVNWEYEESTVNAIRKLKQEGVYVVAVEQVEGSIPLREFKPPENVRLALVFGNEMKGISNEALSLCEGAIEIPQTGTKHSLNVSVSIGVVVWEVAGKLLRN